MGLAVTGGLESTGGVVSLATVSWFFSKYIIISKNESNNIYWFLKIIILDFYLP